LMVEPYDQIEDKTIVSNSLSYDCLFDLLIYIINLIYQLITN
jgi:hypothetical protein